MIWGSNYVYNGRANIGTSSLWMIFRTWVIVARFAHRKTMEWYWTDVNRFMMFSNEFPASCYTKKFFVRLWSGPRIVKTLIWESSYRNHVFIAQVWIYWIKNIEYCSHVSRQKWAGRSRWAPLERLVSPSLFSLLIPKACMSRINLKLWHHSHTERRSGTASGLIVKQQPSFNVCSRVKTIFWKLNISKHDYTLSQSDVVNDLRKAAMYQSLFKTPASATEWYLGA